jgi:hypothetical protein
MGLGDRHNKILSEHLKTTLEGQGNEILLSRIFMLKRLL